MLLVGQAPSRQSNPDKAFSGRSGARLVELSGLPVEEFWGRVDAENLFDRWLGPKGAKGDAFHRVDARDLAVRMMNIFDAAGRGWDYYVLCGRQVAGAFGLDHLDWFALYGIPRFVVIPHPSGANYLWNQPAIVEQARAFFREALPR